MSNRAELCLSAMKSIVRSPDVQCFKVGYTCRAGVVRGDEYRAVGFKHLVILADRLNPLEGVDLEDELVRAWKNADARSVLFKKNDRDQRDKAHKRSRGGSGSKRTAAVYLAWW